ncbi:AMP-binding protein [Streptomyces sp. B1866]|uniref:AMP-binding protein n=1 Tax=Streptomyces sp. B1866 TaxID=3075431 RepID=UPI002890F978|nr:AMP-binding protein [Streptomyces sp. B1866]MDT3398513.1 AMP-binding protein [Streptomyces sp. B1866]
MSHPSHTDEHQAVDAAARQPADVALRWISEPDRVDEFTHGELLDQAACAADVLSRLGVRPGDTVAVHLPLISESIIMTIACGRLGAGRAVLSTGLSARELRDQLRESGAGVLITVDGAGRRKEPQALKPVVDRALTGCPDVRAVLVVHRVRRPVPWTPGRDLWWHEALGRARRTLDA